MMMVTVYKGSRTIFSFNCILVVTRNLGRHKLHSHVLELHFKDRRVLRLVMFGGKSAIILEDMLELNDWHNTVP